VNNLTVSDMMLAEMSKPAAQSLLDQIRACVESETGQPCEWVPNVLEQAAELRPLT
jgi:hypothetical protein